VAARAKDDKEPDVAQELAAAQDVSQLRALELIAEKAQREAQKVEQDLEVRRKKAAQDRRAFEEAQRHAANAQADTDNRDRVVPVIVQAYKDRPVRLPGNYLVPSRTPVKVTRRELRKLQGMSNAGYVQLIVGQLESPGEVYAWDKHAKRQKAEA